MGGDPESIAGYRVLRVLGRGGSGSVYEVADPATGRHVALKLLEPLVGDEARLEREARAAAQVSHVNVARVHAFGREPRTGRPFLVSELVPGGSLAARLERAGRLPWREAAALGAQIARGLEAIHAAGLVHRDVKPANVLLAADGRAQITDFGLVLLAGPVSRRLTATGEVVGTLELLSPEQADGGAGLPVGPPTDLYALGATLHWLAAGKPPFVGTPAELLYRHATARPPALHTIVKDVPPALEALVLRLLSKDPGSRGTAGEVARELEAIARGAGERPAVRGARLAAVALGVLGLAVAVLAAGALGRGSAPPPAGPSPPAPSSPPAARFPGAPAWFERLPDAERPPWPLPRGLRCGDEPGDYLNAADGSRLVFVPAGEFEMGSDAAAVTEERTNEISTRPAHAVSLEAYFVGKLEVSVEQFARFVGACHRVTAPEKPEGLGTVLGEDARTWVLAPGATWRKPDGARAASPGEPVTQVSWHDATAYCEWAGLALPREAQWEKAALWDPRARRARLYAWGDGPPGEGGGRRANLRDEALARWRPEAARPLPEGEPPLFAGYDDGWVKQAPVGSFPLGASAYGALDMTGNVAEWCRDEPRDYPGNPHAVRPEDRSKRCLRGGSWGDRPAYALGAIRNAQPPDYAAEYVGFRVALEVR